MKNLTITLILMILSSSVLFAQIHTSEQIARKKMIASGNKLALNYSDIDPNAVRNPHATTFTDDLFGEHFQFLCGDCSGEAGVETNGEYIYTSKWNGDKFFCYEIDGTFLGEFSIPGVSGIRDMAYDGTYFYGAAASAALFEMDFVGQSGTLISTLTAAVATRACAYNPEYDAFYGNNWSDPITLYDRTGGILNQFNCGVYESYYGFAYVAPSDDGPWLYGFSQAGGASAAVIVQLDPTTGAETGVAFDAIGYSTTGTGSAGGLAEYFGLVPGRGSLIGIIQNETIFGVECCIMCPFSNDLKLTKIIEPNTGFNLGVENIVIKVENYGFNTQGNFDVQYRVDGGEWIVETISENLAYEDHIIFTFNQAYDFSAIGEYFIEAEVILPGDENPLNNTKNKTIENFNSYEWCNYSITMWDSYGDGWNGNYVQIFGDGVEYVNATLASGSGPETVYFLVGDGAYLTAVFTGTAWPEECNYEVYDHNNDLIFADGPNPTGGDIGYASCEQPPPIDAGVIEIISPNSGMLLGIEDVIINVKNFGSETLSEIPVGFKLNEEAWVNEIIPGPIGSGEEIEYTFTTTVDLTGLELIYIQICTFVPDDAIPINDCREIILEIMCDYCQASTITEDEWIANVSMGLIDNSSGWQGGVADYTDISTSVGIGIPEEIIVTNGNAWASDKVTVWCDWNDDFIFDNEIGSNEKFVLLNDGTGSYFTGDITAPAGALGGLKRMRVRMTYDNDPEPCDESSYGEVEDYSVIVWIGGCPEITWNPNSFSQFVEIGQTAQDFLYLGNIGTGALFFNIEVVFPLTKDSLGICLDGEAGAPWLSVNPLEGMILSQGSETITLDFNTGDWPIGTELNANLVLTSSDPVNPEIIIPITMYISPPPEPHFNFEGGDPSSPLWTIYIGNATLGYSNTDLVAGDEIAIFDGGLMVGAFTLNQVCTPSNQFDNDLTAFSVLSTQAGYQAGNEFAFKCWDASEQIEKEIFIYEFFDPYGDAYMGGVFPGTDGEYSIIDINFLSSVTQLYNLSVGYQFISSNIIPDDPDMMLVLSEILNDNLDFVRNSIGQMLRKIGPNWVNGIGDWIIEEGYLIRMFNEDSFSVEGLFVDPETQIPLTEGYQIVSYLPSVSVDALTAFQSIIGDNLNFIRNSNGQTLHKVGPHWINGIGNCISGEGYLIKMSADDILIYATLYPFSCGGTFSDPRDGQVYSTVLIDYQCWMAENLNIGTMINGIEDMTDNNVIEKYCYDNDPANCEEYGGLYQWNEMMQYTTYQWTQGICPEDWHLPGDYELFELENYLDPSITNPNTTGWRGTDCGLKILEGGSSGFEALLAGQRKWDTGEFLALGEFTSFWSSTINPYNQAHSWFRSLNINNPKSYRNGASKFFGSSVRCVRNDGSMIQHDQSSKSFNEESGKKGQLNQNISSLPTYFNLKEANPIEPVWTIYFEKGTLNIGDEIGIYDNDILTGAGIVNSENIFDNVIPVFSNLYEVGNKPIIKAWNKSENIEYILNDYTFSNPYGDAWTENVFPAEDGEYSLLYFSTTGISDENVLNDISIYPNPTTGIITIGNLARTGKVWSIEITDITGKIVSQTDISDNSSSVEIDLSWLEKGVYFIRLRGKDFKQIEKIVIQ